MAARHRRYRFASLNLRRPWLRPAVLFCALPVAYFAALSCLFFGEPRFNFPAIPFLIGGGVFVAAALWRALLPSPTR